LRGRLEIRTKATNGYVFDWYAWQSGQRSLKLFGDKNPLVVPILNKGVVMGEPVMSERAMMGEAMLKEGVMLGETILNEGVKIEEPIKIDFRYYIIVPVLANGWAVLGETNKYVTGSKQRILDIASGTDGIDKIGFVDVKIVGAIGEKVSLVFAKPGGTVVEVQCVIGRGFEARAHCDTKNGCYC